MLSLDKNIKWALPNQEIISMEYYFCIFIGKKRRGCFKYDIHYQLTAFSELVE